MTPVPPDRLGDPLASCWRRSPRVVARPVGGRQVLVPVVGEAADVDRAFVLNELGSFLWHRLDGRADGLALVGLVCERFEVSRERAAEDCRRFLGALLEIGAVEPSA